MGYKSIFGESKLFLIKFENFKFNSIQNNPLSIIIRKFGLVWFGLVLWHINHFGLFNTKSILYIKTVPFQTIQFSISTQFSSIWPIGRTLSGSTTPGQSEPDSDGSEGVLCIPLSITRTSPSDYLESYTGQSLGRVLLLNCSSRLGLLLGRKMSVIFLIDLISLFNDIVTFSGYLMPKHSL